MNNFPFKPLTNYIVVDEIAEEKTKSGLFIPDNAVEAKKDLQVVKHIVVAVSEDVDEKGELFVRKVKVGDRVLLSRGGAEGVFIADKGYVVIRESFVIGVFDDDVIEGTVN